MVIKLLLASNDEKYILRLKDAISLTTLPTGDVIEISMFTDKSNLKEVRDKASSRFHIALVDEELAFILEDFVPNILILTDEGHLDDTVHKEISNALWIYKYQRVSTLLNKVLFAQSKNFGHKVFGQSVVCSFYSPSGGVGTSTVAASFALAASKLGIRPLYVSFEHFNSTEVFFKDSYNNEYGLYNVFYSIAKNEDVRTAIDTAKTKDHNNISFLKKFDMLEEVSKIQADEMESFIEAARSANEIDVVIVDLGSGFNQFNERAFEFSDEIFLISNDTASSLEKLSILFDENFLFGKFREKTNLIFNKVMMKQNLVYGCKSSLHIPNYGKNNDVVVQASEILRGAVKEEWKPRI